MTNIDRDNKMNAILIVTGTVEDELVCPACRHKIPFEVIHEGHYCPYCGQRLDYYNLNRWITNVQIL